MPGGKQALGASPCVSLLVLLLGKLRHGAGSGTRRGVCELIAAVWPCSLMAVFIPWLLTAQLAMVRGGWLPPSPAPTTAGLGDGGLGGGGELGEAGAALCPRGGSLFAGGAGAARGGGDEGNHRVCS